MMVPVVYSFRLKVWMATLITCLSISCARRDIPVPVINMKEVYGRRLVDEKLNAFDVDAMEYNAV